MLPEDVGASVGGGVQTRVGALLAEPKVKPPLARGAGTGQAGLPSRSVAASSKADASFATPVDDSGAGVTAGAVERLQRAGTSATRACGGEQPDPPAPGVELVISYIPTCSSAQLVACSLTCSARALTLLATGLRALSSASRWASRDAASCVLSVAAKLDSVDETALLTCAAQAETAAESSAI